jgi:hypothetical protein
VGWREAGNFAGKVEQMADSLADLLTPEAAASLVELAEYAIEQVENALEQIDDSNNEISNTVDRLGELHRKACALACPDPAPLAERPFDLETTLPFHVCSFDPITYQEALGAEGLRRYRDMRRPSG